MLGLHTARRRKVALAIASAGAIISLGMSPAFAAGGTAQAEGSAADGTGIFDPVTQLLETDSCKAQYANGTLTRNNSQCTPSIETSPAQAVTRFATAAGDGTSSAEGGVASVPLTDLGQLDLTNLIDDLANTNIAASALGPLIAQLGQIGQQLQALTGPIDDALQTVLQGLQDQLPISLEVGAVIARCNADANTAHASSEVADVALQVTLGPQQIPVIFETPVESHSDLIMHAPHQLVDGILSGIEDSLLSAQGPLEPLLAALKLLVTNIDQQVVDALLDALEPTLLKGLSDALAPIVKGEVNHVSNPPHPTNQDGPWSAPDEIDLTALSLTVLNDNTLILGHVHCGDNTAGDNAGPGLKFDKDADVENGDAKFTLTVLNSTNQTKTGVFVQDFYGKDIDASDVKDVKVSQGTFNKNTGRWDVGTLAPGAKAKLTFKVDANDDDLNDGIKNAACVNKSTKPGHIQKNDGVSKDTDGCDETTAKKDNDNSDSDSDSDGSDGPKSVDSGLNDGGNLGPLAISGLLAASALVGSAARQRLLLDR